MGRGDDHDHRQQFNQAINRVEERLSKEIGQNLPALFGDLADGNILNNLVNAIQTNNPQKILNRQKKDLLRSENLFTYLSDINKNGVDKNILTHTYSNLHKLTPEENHALFHEGDSKYILIRKRKTWIEHFIMAYNLGMKLACFDNFQDKTSAEQIAFADGTVDAVWIGGYKHPHYKKWLWVNGKDLESSGYYWNNGEPNNAGGVEHFLQMYKNGKFNDLRNSAKLYALYEIKTEHFTNLNQNKKNLKEGFSAQVSLGTYNEPIGERSDGNLIDWALILGLSSASSQARDQIDLHINNNDGFARAYFPITYNYILVMKDRFNSLLTTYNNVITMVKASLSVLNIKHKQLDDLKRKNNIYRQNSLIDNKKNNYVENDTELYQKIYYFILVLYYLGLIIALIISKFFKNKLYNNKKILLFVILYIILPFILKFILNFVFEAFNNYLEKNNLRDEIISYTDVVNDYENDNPSFNIKL